MSPVLDSCCFAGISLALQRILTTTSAKVEEVKIEKVDDHELDSRDAAEKEFERIRSELESNSFVHIDASTYKRLLVWQGAKVGDLDAMESGRMHYETPTDPEPTMHFRQIAFHRVHWEDSLQSHNGSVNIMTANRPAVTQIAAKEITSDTGAKVFFKRSGTRVWPLPPTSYSQSSIPHAMAKLNAMLTPQVHHPQSNLDNASSTTINDQILIRIKKTSASDESPTPEGIHQDGTEISTVTMVGRRGVTSGGESRIWSLNAPTGNYSSDAFGSFKKTKSIKEADGFDWGHCLFDGALLEPWETIVFNDREVKHEARGFDGIRPCCRDVLVNFVRKPLSDGSDFKDFGCSLGAQ